MGLDLFISIIWLGCLLWVAITAWNAATRKLWYAALGTCLGFGAAVLPVLLVRGPTGFLVTIFIGAAAAVVLTLIYAFTDRTFAAAVVGVVFLVPLIYRLLAKPDSPSARAPGFHGALMTVGELMMLTAPIVITLAFREIFALVDRRRSLSKA
jgi:hypothetical protein